VADDKATATFTLNLDGNAVTSAEDTAAALEKLQGSIEADEAALKGFQATLRRLRGDGAASTKTIQDLTARIKAQKAAIGAKAAQQLKIGGIESVAKLAPKKPKIEAAITANPAAIQKLAATAPKVGAAFTKAATAATAAFAAFAVAAASSIGVIVAKFGFLAADERRDEALRLEGLARYRNYWAELLGFVRKADSGSTLLTIVDRVTDSTAAARGEVSGLVEEFYKAGFRGKVLQDVVEAGSIALTTQGRAGVEQFKAMATTARLFGNSASGVAAQWKARLGDIAQRQMLSFGVQVRKLRENLTRLFSGVKIEGFLRLFAQIVSLFSQTTIQGRQLSQIMSILFNPFNRGAETAADLVESLFDHGLNYALRFIVAVLDVRDAFLEITAPIRAAYKALGQIGKFVEDNSFLKGARDGFKEAAMQASLFGLSLGDVRGALSGIDSLLKSIVGVFVKFSGQWAKLGKAIPDGLAVGVRAGSGAAVGEVTTFADRLNAAGRNGLEVHSPSRVFAYQGRMIGAGIETGVKASIPGAEAAVETMTERIAPKTEPVTPRRSDVAAASTAAQKAGPTSITIGDINIHGAPGDADEEWSRKIRNEVIGLLQGVGLQMGAA
jgi:hypothetical protein